ncbi:hypothetical protein RKD45_006215 [Streptomyces griseus]
MSGFRPGSRPSARSLRDLDTVVRPVPPRSAGPTEPARPTSRYKPGVRR